MSISRIIEVVVLVMAVAGYLVAVTHGTIL